MYLCIFALKFILTNIVYINFPLVRIWMGKTFPLLYFQPSYDIILFYVLGDSFLNTHAKFFILLTQYEF